MVYVCVHYLQLRYCVEQGQEANLHSSRHTQHQDLRPIGGHQIDLPPLTRLCLQSSHFAELNTSHETTNLSDEKSYLSVWFLLREISKGNCTIHANSIAAAGQTFFLGGHHAYFDGRAGSPESGD